MDVDKCCRLFIRRRTGEKVRIGEALVTVYKIANNTHGDAVVHFSIEAPRRVLIQRTERGHGGGLRNEAGDQDALG